MTKNFKPEIVCVQLVMTVELMATSIDVWYSHLSSNHVAYGLLSDVHRSLVHLVKELTKDVEIFWQVFTLFRVWIPHLFLVRIRVCVEVHRVMKHKQIVNANNWEIHCFWSSVFFYIKLSVKGGCLSLFYVSCLKQSSTCSYQKNAFASDNPEWRVSLRLCVGPKKNLFRACAL